MQKKLHIWLKGPVNYNVTKTSLFETLQALHSGEEIVHTTQPHVCSTKWLLKGYRIFVHMLDDEVVELKLGQCCGRELRIAHNLEKMLLANVFGKATADN